MHKTLARALWAAAAALPLLLPAVGAQAATVPLSTAAAAVPPGPAATAGAPGSGHVIVAGIGGLRWSDVSPTATPVLWRLAGQGSVGSLIVSGISPRTCPTDGWLTLNSAARAAVPHQALGRCPALPRVAAVRTPFSPVPAQVPAMPRIVAYNTRFHYSPQWGLLATAAGAGRCATAAGPGAALALAGRDGRVSSYLPSPSRLTPAVLARCPLTVIDLGDLPSAGGRAGQAARSAALAAADHELGAIRAGLPPHSTLIVVAPGDGLEPHLRVLVATGPADRHGLLSTASTRRPGMAVLTDVTPSVLAALGAPVPSAAVGSELRSTARGGQDLAATVNRLVAQDTAAQVYRDTVTPFYQVVGIGFAVLFALIWLIPLGRGEARGRRRRSVARVVGLWAASVPAGTFLASLVPWWAHAHPALLLYALAMAWAVVLAAVASAGPWRRDPLGPTGMVATVTLAVIGLDLITGSRLQLETPFGLSMLEAGRFYGLGNNAVVIYGACAVLSAAWLGGAALRRGNRARAVLIVAAVTGAAVVAAGWPGFGAKVGGTIAMVPGFLLLLAATANIRLTWRRALLAAASGLALVVVFALINYFVPVTGHSDIGGFVGKALHGGAGSILRRKVSSNVGSLGANPFVVAIPVVVALLGLVVAWPDRARATLLARAYQQVPLLKAVLSAVWVIAVLGWFAEDSGVTVPAAALPFVLPLTVVILSSLPRSTGPAEPREQRGSGPAETPPLSLSQADDRAGWRN